MHSVSEKKLRQDVLRQRVREKKEEKKRLLAGSKQANLIPIRLKMGCGSVQTAARMSRV